ncbi:MAG: hypothetical protein AAFV32_04690 [Myxococcota bacterium]
MRRDPSGLFYRFQSGCGPAEGGSEITDTDQINALFLAADCES